MSKGCIHIYTGEGKGKTTASVGLTVRARSRGLRILFVQFMKGGATPGEINLLRDIHVSIKKFSKIRSPYFNPDIDRKQLRKYVDEAITYIEDVMNNKNFDMIVLDEFNCLITEGLLSEDRAVKLISSKPANLELILTGRGATKRLIQTADYVTEMRVIKHPFSKGIKARKGIEY